jgi:hypothetical protein
MQFLKAGNFGWNYAHDHGTAAALHKNIDAKTGSAWQAVGNVARTLLAQVTERMFIVADQLRGDVTGIVGRQARAPTAARRPLTSTKGGLPGVKKRSLILGALRSIVANNDAVENAAGAGAAAVAT